MQEVPVIGRNRTCDSVFTISSVLLGGEANFAAKVNDLFTRRRQKKRREILSVNDLMCELCLDTDINKLY